MSLQHSVASAATTPTLRLRLRGRIPASREAIRTLAAEHPGTPLRELVPPVYEASITCKIAPGWRAIYTLEPDADGAPVVAGIRLDAEDGSRPAGGVPATIWRRATTRDALMVARECFYKLRKQGGRRLIESHGFNSIATTALEGRRVTDRRYAVVAATYAEVKATGSRRALVDTAERLELTYSQVRHCVDKARRRGLLDGSKLTDRGRAAAALSPSGCPAGAQTASESV